MRRAQPVGQRLQLIAAAGGKPEVAAFLGKGFGGGGTNALGRAGDEDALAAQMQIHGIFSLVGYWAGQGGVASFDGPPAGVNTALQRCVAARFGPLQSLQKGVVLRKVSMSTKKQYRIAVIPGDGIGKEVMPEGLRVIETAAKKHGVALHFDPFDF